MSTDKQISARVGVKQRDAEKIGLIAVKNISSEPLPPPLAKPAWLKVRVPANMEPVEAIKSSLRQHGLHSVCEEASCPNLAECFSRGTATFMILGSICTRRCPFCDVAHGRPLPPDPHEPLRLADTVRHMGLNYVVITSVDRDDLQDGGAGQFSSTVRAIRSASAGITIEILVPDFRGRMEHALECLQRYPPDVFNHNLENVPRLYRQVRPGANYRNSLLLLQKFKEIYPSIPTKSGLMVGLGESNQEIIEVMGDLYDHGVTMLTIGQYLQPSRFHLPVQRYVDPAEFSEFRQQALNIGFKQVASGPFVRSSYHADLLHGATPEH